MLFSFGALEKTFTNLANSFQRREEVQLRRSLQQQQSVSLGARLHSIEHVGTTKQLFHRSEGLSFEYKKLQSVAEQIKVLAEIDEKLKGNKLSAKARKELILERALHSRSLEQNHGGQYTLNTHALNGRAPVTLNLQTTPFELDIEEVVDGVETFEETTTSRVIPGFALELNGLNDFIRVGYNDTTIGSDDYVEAGSSDEFTMQINFLFEEGSFDDTDRIVLLDTGTAIQGNGSNTGLIDRASIRLELADNGDGTARLFIYQGAGTADDMSTEEIDTGVDLTADEFQHLSIARTFTGSQGGEGEFSVYLNGERKNVAAFQQTPHVDLNTETHSSREYRQVILGRALRNQGDEVKKNLEGQIASFAFFREARSEEQILSDVQEHLSPSAPFLSEEGLIGFYSPNSIANQAAGSHAQQQSYLPSGVTFVRSEAIGTEITTEVVVKEPDTLAERVEGTSDRNASIEATLAAFNAELGALRHAADLDKRFAQGLEKLAYAEITQEESLRTQREEGRENQDSFLVSFEDLFRLSRSILGILHVVNTQRAQFFLNSETEHS